MATFSQLVDEAIQQTRRPDMIAEAAMFANQTIREVHARSDTGSILEFPANFREQQIEAASLSIIWDIPNPATFQTLSLAMYPGVPPIFSEAVQPNRAMDDHPVRHYRAGNQYVFSGASAPGRRLNLGFYEFPSRLKYYPIANRPALYDDALGWVYAQGIDTPERQLAARLVSSNWLTLGWHDVILQGILSKIYTRVSDESRSTKAYSLFTTLRQGLWTTAHRS